MFEAILERKGIGEARIGTGAVASVALHAGALALILLLSSSAARSAHGEKDLAVKFIAPTELPPPPAPPPLLASAMPQQRRREHRPSHKKETLVRQPLEERPRNEESEQRPEPNNPEARPEGVSGGVPGGVAGGVLGGAAEGVPGGRLGGSLGGGVLPFGEGMTRPEQIRGDPPKYTREALAAGIQGTILVKCVISVDGTLENCRIIKPLPHMDKAVLDALSGWRYKPVHYQGRPVAVDYLIQIRLVIPH